MVRLVSILFAAVLTAGVASAQAPFPDVPDDHWAVEAVERLADLGVIVGYPDGNFRGNRQITRYEAALMFDRLLSRLAGDPAAATAALANQVEVLQRALAGLIDETQELRALVDANRTALEELWDEVARLRDEMGLPPPEPLAPLPQTPQQEGATPPAAPGEPEERPDAGAPPAAEEDVRRERADPAEPEAPVVGETDAVEDLEVRPVTPPEVAAPRAIVGTEPGGYAAFALGTNVPPRPILRAAVGVENVPAPQFGARLTVDVGRRSVAPLAGVSVLGHGTYRVPLGGSLRGYVGLGAGMHIAGDGPFASLLVGGVWHVGEPVALVIEATLDAYLMPELPSGGARVTPTFAIGGRWDF